MPEVKSESDADATGEEAAGLWTQASLSDSGRVAAGTEDDNSSAQVRDVVVGERMQRRRRSQPNTLQGHSEIVHNTEYARAHRQKPTQT